MLTGGPLDVLTGDYLAELTMLILGRDRLKDPALGYAKTYLRQLEGSLGLAVDRGVRLVANAGGLNPAGLADAIRGLAARLGVPVAVAHVEGDDLMPYEDALTANAYLGGWGITECLRAGADVVVTGRVTDAALVSGPAAWFFDWARDDYDALAGAVVAGHVLECGTQATGGNYALFTGHDVRRPGFPLAEVARDGSAVITKHPGTGGVVNTGTVTAQLLYETQGARYLGPDVVARLDTVRLTQQGPDRVLVSGTRGEPAPGTLKLGLTRIGGWRNEVVFVLTGLDVEAKAALLKAQLADALAGIASAEWTLARTDHEDAATQETASALLRLTVKDPDPAKVGRPLTSKAIELALASYPGFHVTSPPAPPTPYGTFASPLIPSTTPPHRAVLPNGTSVPIAPAPAGAPATPVAPAPVGVPATPVAPAPVGASAAPVAPAPEGDRTAGHAGGTRAEPAAQASAPQGYPAPPASPAPPAFEELGAPPAVAGGGYGGGAPATGPGGARGTEEGRVGDSPAGQRPAPGNNPHSEAAPPGTGTGTDPHPEPPAPGTGTGTETVRIPLGRIAGARSGDKGGDANLGLWTETDPAYEWLRATLTVPRLKELLPETAPLHVTRHELPNLRALNFVITGLLGDGAAAQHRFDPQAKALGEWLRARHVDVPSHLAPQPPPPQPPPPQ
ncbi:acyclic terpene utilization AtuA family protein [Streptomyces sp. NPDC086023]|uniref:acyclic terpene utilization AtuA family protein n=1 Tax=Streptomyces sp. NPDC086023 TaxID=3365746 RepID=UPI0037CF5B75